MHGFMRGRITWILAAFLMAHHPGATAADDKGQDHVDFSAGGEEAPLTFGLKGEDHIDFRAGEPGISAQAEFSTSPGGAFSLTADLTLGASDAAVALFGEKAFDQLDLSSDGEKGEGHIDFRITIHPDGRVDVGGEEIAVCDPAEPCRVSLAWSASAGTLVVQIWAADGTLVAAQYHLDDAPSELRVEAAEILWLSVAPE